MIDIPYSTRTIRGTNLIQRCQWDHLLEGILKGVCIWAAGLELSIVSTDGLLCRFCIGCSLSLNNLTAISVLAGEKHILFGMQVQNFCVGIVQYFLP